MKYQTTKRLEVILPATYIESQKHKKTVNI